MRKIEVTLIDDLDNTPASRTVTFALDNKSYQIDLSDANYDKLEAALAPFVAKGTRITRQKGSAPAATATAVSRSATGEVRKWAKAQGHAVPERGRIPNDILALYEAAHS